MKLFSRWVQYFLVVLWCGASALANERETVGEAPEWFKDAKLGIFIHWGIYAVDGTVESGSIYQQDMSYEDYMSQINGFTASKYDPDAWAQLFREAGARYAVLTSKHHDGVALWDTGQLTGGKNKRSAGRGYGMGGETWRFDLVRRVRGLPNLCQPG